MFLYTTGIYLYWFAIRIAALFSRKARLMVRGRHGQFPKMQEVLAETGDIIWIHCASLGEFEQGRPVIEKIRETQPGRRILLTFFSPSGYEIRKDYEGADFVFYLPMDTPRNVRRFIRAVRPTTAIFVKYEFWLNYLGQLRRNNIPTYIVSAIFRRDSVFFRPYGSIFRRGLKAFTGIFVQDENSKQLLAGIGVTNVTVTGDTRFDRVSAIAETSVNLPVLKKFAGGSPVLVAGSTWPPDEEIILRLLADFPEMKMILAPHEIEQERIDKIIANSNGTAMRYSAAGEDTSFDATRLLIIDRIGLLSKAYRYGTYAYIGGGFGAGIHNTLEAAAYGRPMAFGPNYTRFREAVDLIRLNCAQPVQTYDDLLSWLRSLTSNPQEYAEAKAKALSYIAYNKNVADKIVNIIFKD